VKKEPAKVILRCIGERKEPSKEALDRFISIYLEMVKENQSKFQEEIVIDRLSGE
jgi:hypothetical protein